MSNATTVPINDALLAVADEETTRALVRDAMAEDGFLPTAEPLPVWTENITPVQVVCRHFRLDLNGGGHLDVEDVGHEVHLYLLISMWPYFFAEPENLPTAVALIVPKLRLALAALERMLEAQP